MDLTSARPMPSAETAGSSVKTASRKPDGARRRVLGWPDVLRALSSDEARSSALALFRTAGFTPDQFGHVRAAREAVVDALARTEDLLEVRCPRREAERRAVQSVRRSLELELWP